MSPRRSFLPIRLDALQQQDVEPIELIEELLAEVNNRLEDLHNQSTGRGQSISQTALTFATGNLANVPQLGAGVLFQLSSPKAATISGFGGGYGGRVVVIQNTGSATYTITHEGTTALPGERVTTRTGASLSVTTGAGLVLIYDDTTSRWIPVSTQL